MYFVDIKKLKKAMIDADCDNIVTFESRSGVNRRTIASILGGEYPSSNVMIKMATALDLSSEQCGEIFFARKLTSDVSEE